MQKSLEELLLNKDLSGFILINATEVFRTNEDGVYVSSIGYFRDPNIAEAFAGQEKDSNYTKTQKVLVLTDGSIAFVIDSPKAITFMNENEELVKVKRVALAKLTDIEKQLLGISE